LPESQIFFGLKDYYDAGLAEKKFKKRI
jgi:hypothetical protein